MNDKVQSLEEIVEELKERFAADVYEFRSEVSLVIKPGQILDVCQTLHADYDFEMLVAQSAVDYWPQLTPRFHVIYRLRSLEHNQIIGLRVPLDGNAPHIPTVEGIYKNANWFERELWDMFGIIIDGHSDLRRILMPHDWEGHPLRKDYPLGYEEVQFTFNYDEINQRKPYAKE